MSDPLLDPALPPRPERGAQDTAEHESAPVAEAHERPNVPMRPGRHSGWQRLILVVNILIVGACFAGAIVLVAGKRVRESVQAAPQASVVGAEGVPVNSDGVFVGDPNVTFPPADPEAKNFLIVGDDSHACVDADSPWAGAADPERSDIGQRSDTIMLVRVDPSTQHAAILSFPRDLWVKVPGHGKSRINSAYRKGDYTLMAQTLYDNFGVKVDHYVQVDFCAFKTIVDAVGGVAVPFEQPVKDDHVNLHIDEVGCHTFTGDEALAYVRSRYFEYQTPDGKWHSDNAYDLGRISRQQDFLRRLFETAQAKGVFNASVAKGLIDTLTKYVVVDQSSTIDDMLQFLGVLRQVQATGVPTYQIAATRQIVQNNDVLLAQVDTPEMQQILDIFRGKASLGSAPEASAPDTTGLETTGPNGLLVTTTTVPSATTSASPTTDAPSTSVEGTSGADPTQPTKGIVPPAGVSC